MKQLIEFIAQTLAEYPDAVEVVSSGSRRMELRVAPTDLGRLIGRKGRTAQAMRTLLRAAVPGRDGIELDIAERAENGSE